MRLLPKSRDARSAIVIVAVVVGVNLVTVVVDSVIPSPDGPRSSSFATSPEGAAAWADLIRRSGGEVRALRERVSDESLPAEGTVVVLDPDSFTDGQARALRRFAERGGRVVAGGAEPGDWVGELTNADPPRWESGGDPSGRVLVPAPETGTAANLRTAEAGHWEDAGGALPLAAGADGPIALVEDAGERADRAARRRLAAAEPAARRGRQRRARRSRSPARAGHLRRVRARLRRRRPGWRRCPPRFRWALGLLALARCC